MNLYLVLAIALGAITGVVEAPVVRPAQLIAVRNRGVQQRSVRVTRVRKERPAVLWSSEPRTEDRGPRTRGEAAPRAPAFV